MCLSGLMTSKSGSKPRSPRLFPRRGNSQEGQYKLASKLCYCEGYVKKMWGETEGQILLSWGILFVGGRVVRQGRWEGSQVGRWEDSQVGRWERWEVSELGR